MHKFDCAETSFTQALAIRDRVYGPTHTLTARVCSNLALVHLDQGNRQAANVLQARAKEAFDAVCVCLWGGGGMSIHLFVAWSEY